MNKYVNSNIFKIVLVLLIVFQPIIELDYLIYDFLNTYGIPRLSTILKFIILPAMIILGFYYYDNNKKRTIIISSVYIIALTIYFIMHCNYASGIVGQMYLPDNFYFNIFDELVYIVTLVLPYFLIYLFYKSKFENKFVKYASVGSSLIISLPILLSNLVVYSLSTYVGYTKDNMFSWFGDGYDDFIPRELAGKFFFDQGNSIGILLCMILPILYYFYFKSNNRKEKILISVIIFTQSISMMILSTRVAVYGSILAAIIVMAVFVFCIFIMKNEKINKINFSFPIVMVLLLGQIIPHTPMIQNQLLNQENDQAVADDDYMLDDAKEKVLLMVENSATKNDVELVKAFEKYGIEDNLISAVPVDYFMGWYPYTHDASFWLDLLFNVPFYERVNGRQIQQIFIDYKMNDVPDSISKSMLGSGYSTFMNGSLILEKDFNQQLYSFGFGGFSLMVLPWLLLIVYGGVRVLLNYKKLFRADILILASSVIFGLGGAYMSGHTLDQVITTTFMALLAGVLLYKVNSCNKG